MTGPDWTPGGATIDTYTLEWLKLGVQRTVSAEFAESVNAKVFHEVIWGDLVHQLTARVLADQLPPETVTDEHTFFFYIPASPWQQFKDVHADAWWLRWLLKHRPPVMVTHTRYGKLTVDLKRYQVYPQAKFRHLGQHHNTFVVSRAAQYWPEAATDE